jgi:predicted enzyme related to lactoylglutathione lyase
MDRAVTFYEKAFGFSVENRNPNWVNITCGRGKIGLAKFPPQSEAQKSPPLIIEVDDYKEAVKRIEAAGGTVDKVAEPYPGAPVYNVMFTDTEGNHVVASQHVAGQ